MLVAIDCWEYDVKAAGKTFLESLGYKLSNIKKKYVVEVGLTFKAHPELQKQFYNEMKQLLLNQITPDINLLRYYVDEVVIDRKHSFISNKYKLKENHIKLMIVEQDNKFIKVYDESVKISKTFGIQSKTVWQILSNILNNPIKKQEKQKLIIDFVKKYLNQKFTPDDYIVVTKDNKKVIVYKNFIQNADQINNQFIGSINKEVYYNFLFKYLHSIV